MHCSPEKIKTLQIRRLAFIVSVILYNHVISDQYMYMNPALYFGVHVHSAPIS